MNGALRAALRERVVLFWMGFLQVSLVGVNTWQIAHEKWVGMAVVGFLIGYVWSWNVKKIAFGGQLDRLIYSAGSMAGLLSGLLIVMWYYR
jgi:hypothetical protein